ncbi:MAG: hypothetical protein K2W95_07515 [Candidatus Obscuribacterales bacterium]|nr:hypothetical protein [Candidatus Obscuribacterales bacterium]
MGDSFRTGGDSSKVLHGEGTKNDKAELDPIFLLGPEGANAQLTAAEQPKHRNVSADVVGGVLLGTAGGASVGLGKAFLDAATFQDFRYPTGNEFLRLDPVTKELSPAYVCDSVKNWVNHGSPAAQTYRQALEHRPWAKQILADVKTAQWEATDAVREVLHRFRGEREALRTTSASIAGSNELFTRHLIKEGLTPGSDLAGKLGTIDRHVLETARDTMAKEASLATDAARANRVYDILENPASAAFRPSLGRHALMGAIAASGAIALDYGVSKSANMIFGEQSTMAQILRPNAIGAGMTASAFVAPVDWRTRCAVGAGTWVGSKLLNVGSDYFTSSGMFAESQLKPELSTKYNFLRK